MELQWLCMLMTTFSREYSLWVTEMACQFFLFLTLHNPSLLTTACELHCRPTWFTALKCEDKRQKTTTSEKVNSDPSASWRQDKHTLQIDHFKKKKREKEKCMCKFCKLSIISLILCLSYQVSTRLSVLGNLAHKLCMGFFFRLWLVFFFLISSTC